MSNDHKACATIRQHHSSDHFCHCSRPPTKLECKSQPNKNNVFYRNNVSKEHNSTY